MNNDYIDKITEKVKMALSQSSDQSQAHLWPHIEGVLEIAKFLAEKSGKKINPEELMLAVLGHDIVQPYNINKVEHVANSMKKYGAMLRESGYPEDGIKNVLQIISEHSSEIIKPLTTNEAKILWIADKWDGVGPEGIRRARDLCHQKGMTDTETIRWYKNKVEKAAPIFLELLKEFPGSEIAIVDVEYSLEFIKEAERTQKF